MIAPSMIHRSVRSSLLVGVVVAQAAWGDVPRFAEGDATGTIHLTAEPVIGNWQSIEGQTHRWRSEGGYRLQLTRTSAGEHGQWTLQLSRSDGSEFRVTHLVWRAETSLAYVATVFDTQAHSPTSLLRRAPAIDAAIEVRPNQGVPYQAASDHHGNNRLAVGSLDTSGRLFPWSSLPGGKRPPWK